MEGSMLTESLRTPSLSVNRVLVLPLPPKSTVGSVERKNEENRGGGVSERGYNMALWCRSFNKSHKRKYN